MVTAPDAGFRLGIDFGTSHTTAILRWPDGHVRPLLFDGSPLLPSAIFVEADGSLLVGRDAIHAARLDPARFEPTPKRRIQNSDAGTDQGPSTVEMVAAVLARVAGEAERVSTTPVADMEVTLTHPAAWDIARITVLVRAARAAGLAQPRLVAEPVAAAGYFVATLGRSIPAGSALVVYDFGGGTFDASVVAPSDDGTGYEVLALDGLTDVGGVDIDAALFRHVAGRHRATDPEAWQRLEEPKTPADRRHRRHLVEDVRAAKEMLSRANAATVPIPLLELEARITRDEFDTLARPLLDRTVATTVHVVQSAGVHVAAVLLVGGSSRIPLVIGLLRDSTGIEPSTIDQPETVVAEGSIRLAEGGTGDTRASSAVPAPRPAPAPVAVIPVPPPVAVPASPVPPHRPADPWAAATPAGLAPTLIQAPLPAPPPRPAPATWVGTASPTQPRPVPEHQVPYLPVPSVPQQRRPRRRRRWPAVLAAFVAVAAIGVGTVYAMPYLSQLTGGVTPTNGPTTTNPAPKTPVARPVPPAWVPTGWSKIVDDADRTSVIPGDANNGGACAYTGPGLLHVTRASYGVSGCRMEQFAKDYSIQDAAIEAEFGLVAGCGGMWMRTGAVGYFVAVCADGTVTLHRLADDPPSALTQLGPYWRPGFARERVIVGLLAQGATLTLYIDGVPQTSVTDDTIPKGRLGLGGFGPHPDDRVDATITRFRVWQPGA